MDEIESKNSESKFFTKQVIIAVLVTAFVTSILCICLLIVLAGLGINLGDNPWGFLPWLWA